MMGETDLLTLALVWDVPTNSWINQGQSFMTYDPNNNNLTSLLPELEHNNK